MTIDLTPSERITRHRSEEESEYGQKILNDCRAVRSFAEALKFGIMRRAEEIEDQVVKAAKQIAWEKDVQFGRAN